MPNKPYKRDTIVLPFIEMSDMTVKERREYIEEIQCILETVIEQDKDNEVNNEPRHYLLDGMYGRSLFIPEDTLIVGKIHLREQLIVLLRGDITIGNENGVKRIVAPSVFVSPAGIKRAGYTHTDTEWLAISTTSKDNITDIEDELFVNNYSDIDKES